MPEDEFDDDDDARARMNFRDPGGRSALRAGKRIHPCPTCGRKKQLTDKDRQLGYQCDRCADEDEGLSFPMRSDY